MRKSAHTFPRQSSIEAVDLAGTADEDPSPRASEKSPAACFDKRGSCGAEKRHSDRTPSANTLESAGEAKTNKGFSLSRLWNWRSKGKEGKLKKNSNKNSGSKGKKVLSKSTADLNASAVQEAGLEPLYLDSDDYTGSVYFPRCSGIDSSCDRKKRGNGNGFSEIDSCSDDSSECYSNSAHDPVPDGEHKSYIAVETKARGKSNVRAVSPFTSNHDWGSKNIAVNRSLSVEDKHGSYCDPSLNGLRKSLSDEDMSAMKDIKLATQKELKTSVESIYGKLWLSRTSYPSDKTQENNTFTTARDGSCFPEKLQRNTLADEEKKISGENLPPETEEEKLASSFTEEKSGSDGKSLLLDGIPVSKSSSTEVISVSEGKNPISSETPDPEDSSVEYQLIIRCNEPQISKLNTKIETETSSHCRNTSTSGIIRVNNPTAAVKDSEKFVAAQFLSKKLKEKCDSESRQLQNAIMSAKIQKYFDQPSPVSSADSSHYFPPGDRMIFSDGEETEDENASKKFSSLRRVSYGGLSSMQYDFRSSTLDSNCQYDVDFYRHRSADRYYPNSKRLRQRVKMRQIDSHRFELVEDKENFSSVKNKLRMLSDRSCFSTNEAAVLFGSRERSLATSVSISFTSNSMISNSKITVTQTTSVSSHDAIDKSVCLRPSHSRKNILPTRNSDSNYKYPQSPSLTGSGFVASQLGKRLGNLKPTSITSSEPDIGERLKLSEKMNREVKSHHSSFPRSVDNLVDDDSSPNDDVIRLSPSSCSIENKFTVPRVLQTSNICSKYEPIHPNESSDAFNGHDSRNIIHMSKINLSSKDNVRENCNSKSADKSSPYPILTNSTSTSTFEPHLLTSESHVPISNPPTGVTAFLSNNPQSTFSSRPQSHVSTSHKDVEKLSRKSPTSYNTSSVAQNSVQSISVSTIITPSEPTYSLCGTYLQTTPASQPTNQQSLTKPSMDIFEPPPNGVRYVDECLVADNAIIKRSTEKYEPLSHEKTNYNGQKKRDESDHYELDRHQEDDDEFYLEVDIDIEKTTCFIGDKADNNTPVHLKQQFATGNEDRNTESLKKKIDDQHRNFGSVSDESKTKNIGKFTITSFPGSKTTVVSSDNDTEDRRKLSDSIYSSISTSKKRHGQAETCRKCSDSAIYRKSKPPQSDAIGDSRKDEAIPSPKKQKQSKASKGEGKFLVNPFSRDRKKKEGNKFEIVSSDRQPQENVCPLKNSDNSSPIESSNENTDQDNLEKICNAKICCEDQEPLKDNKIEAKNENKKQHGFVTDTICFTSPIKKVTFSILPEASATDNEYGREFAYSEHSIRRKSISTDDLNISYSNADECRNVLPPSYQSDESLASKETSSESYSQHAQDLGCSEARASNRFIHEDGGSLERNQMAQSSQELLAPAMKSTKISEKSVAGGNSTEPLNEGASGIKSRSTFYPLSVSSLELSQTNGSSYPLSPRDAGSKSHKNGDRYSKGSLVRDGGGGSLSHLILPSTSSTGFAECLSSRFDGNGENNGVCSDEIEISRKPQFISPLEMMIPPMNNRDAKQPMFFKLVGAFLPIVKVKILFLPIVKVKILFLPIVKVKILFLPIVKVKKSFPSNR